MIDDMDGFGESGARGQGAHHRLEAAQELGDDADNPRRPRPAPYGPREIKHDRGETYVINNRAEGTE